MPHEIFVSHSTEDKIAADALVARFERDGIKCWYAPRDIPTGDNWPTAITNAIRSARAMVLVFSEHANQSDHVGREVDLALKRGIPVVPVRIDHVVPQGELEYFLATAHWMDATSPPFERHCDDLANRVRGLLDKPLLPRAPAAEPSRFASHRLRTALMIVGVVAALGALTTVIVSRHLTMEHREQAGKASTTVVNSAPAFATPEILSPANGEVVIGPILQYAWKEDAVAGKNRWYEIERAGDDGRSSVDRVIRWSYNETSLYGNIRWRIRAGRTEKLVDVRSDWTPWRNAVHYQDTLAKIVATHSVWIAVSEEDGTFVRIENGRASGFEIEFIRAVLGQYLKKQGITEPLQVNYTLHPWGDLLFTSLDKATSDLVGSGISITQERVKKYHVVFTDPIAEFPPAFLRLEGSSFDASKLNSTNIGAQAETTDFALAQRLASLHPGVTAKAFDGSDANLQMVHALVDGTLDAAVVDYPYGISLKELYGAQGIRLVPIPIDDKILPDPPVEHVGFMTRPLDTRLRDLINTAIHSDSAMLKELLQQQHLLGVMPGKSGQ